MPPITPNLPMSRYSVYVPMRTDSVKDTDKVVEAEKCTDDFLVVLHDDVDPRSDTLIYQLYNVT